MNIRGYVGIPYVDKGRDRTGCDCWGLVRLVHTDHGVEVPTYGEISADELLRVSRAVKSQTDDDQTWINVTNQPRRAFDCVVMRHTFRPGETAGHIGIMVSPTVMLHTEKGVGAIQVALNDPTVRPRILNFYRHRCLP